MKLGLAIGLGLSLGLISTSCQKYWQPPDTSQSAPQAPTEANPEPVSPAPDTSTSTPEPTALETLPRVDADGNYLRTSHRRWVVVDRDPAGLNCRWSEAIPEEWYSPAAQYPRMNVSEWSVVQQLPTHTEILANITPAGFAIMYDENEQPWLKVSLNDQDDICLVRAHKDYVQPVR